jgi:hypothetical protein
MSNDLELRKNIEDLVDQMILEACEKLEKQRISRQVHALIDPEAFDLSVRKSKLKKMTQSESEKSQKWINLVEKYVRHKRREYMTNVLDENEDLSQFISRKIKKRRMIFKSESDDDDDGCPEFVDRAEGGYFSWIWNWVPTWN